MNPITKKEGSGLSQLRGALVSMPVLRALVESLFPLQLKCRDNPGPSFYNLGFVLSVYRSGLRLIAYLRSTTLLEGYELLC